MSEGHKETNMSEELSIAEQLQKLFEEKLGGNWRKNINMDIRADNLYWLIFLAEAGINAKKEEMRKTKTPQVELVASVASWQLDLEALLAKIKQTLK